jgi:DNA-binding LytR/AlgR family response regulator
MNCIIVDDEPLSIRILEKYVKEIPNVNLVASCENAFEAMEITKKASIDVMFLDINMPKLSGLSLVKSLSNPPLVVFTTAYPEYAVKGFELEAVDYLLKPFSLERFITAVQKVEEKLTYQNAKITPEKTADFLIVKADKKLYKIDFQQIINLQAFGDYVKIFTERKMYLTKDKLSNIEKELPQNEFVRIHRSHIIALSKIEFIEGNLVKIGSEKLPIASTYKENLMTRLSR